MYAVFYIYMYMEAVVVYADGVFDAFHHGHARMLEQAKAAVDGPVRLVVGLHSDADVLANKGPTVMTYAERREMLRHIKWVDEVCDNAPWKITEEFMIERGIDWVAHDGDPYPSADGQDLYEVPKRLGRFIATQRTPGVSTTDIVQRVLDNTDLYRSRNEGRRAKPHAT